MSQIELKKQLILIKSEKIFWSNQTSTSYNFTNGKLDHLPGDTASSGITAQKPSLVDSIGTLRGILNGTYHFESEVESFFNKTVLPFNFSIL